jgi:hypothetical protein
MKLRHGILIGNEAASSVSARPSPEEAVCVLAEKNDPKIRGMPASSAVRTLMQQVIY